MLALRTIVRKNSYLTQFKKVGDKSGEVWKQSSNRSETWSENQRPKSDVFVGPKFEQKDLKEQPNPPAAIELISKHPIQVVEERVVSCDGGDSALGHPKVYINLDKGKPVACGYCGKRFQQKNHH